ncbi:titin-like isoform X2 [Trematomus bernacchii]|uniref:titin-like isoform X2 n=1 Tax=Trematomus bernacchii TaxID=40690 RepID=UPI00146CA83D|nr:titin-like isoform X2 [Trematomus bernacchii]
MKFPVDLLAGVSQSEVERSAHAYMNSLLYSDPDCPDQLRLSDSTQVTIDVSSVGFIPLYGSSDKQRILALFSPSDPLTAVALFLLDRWWTVDGLLQTGDPERDGAMEVETVGERIVLYILNRVVYRAQEMSSEELPFLCHGEKDHAKILWSHGEAVGFYSVKPQGTLCNSYSTRSYQLTVMDSIFVRKGQRGNGFGLQMLEDFVLSSKEDCLGLRYPLTKPMYKVCEKYLCQYPEDTHLLWEVESIGAPNQRTNISSRIQAMDQIVSKSLTFTEESLVITEMTEKDVVMEAISTQIKEAESMECTVEIVEEVTVLSATKVSEAEVPLTARGRSSGSKRRKTAEKIAEEKSEKIIRIEDIEAETPREEHVAESLQTEDVTSVVPEEQGQDVVDTEATILDQPDGGDAPQDLNTCSHDSQIAVENVASGIEEDTAVLPLCEDISLVPKEAETLHSVEQAATVGQQVVSLSTHAAAENGEAEETRGAVVKAKKSAQSKTPRRKSTRHSKQEEEEAKEGPAAQDGRISLRGRTVVSTPKTTRKYTRRSQRVRDEVDGVSTPEAGTEGEEQEEKSSVKEGVDAVEELAEDKLEENEEETEKQQEQLAVKASSTELTAETAATQDHEEDKGTDECEEKQTGDEATENKPDVSEEEAEEPPVVQKRALRGRYKVATKQSQDLQKPEEQHLDEGEQKAEEQAADQPMEERQQVEEEEKADQTEGETSTEENTVAVEETVPKAEEVSPSTEVNVEGVQVEEETTEPEEETTEPEEETTEPEEETTEPEEETAEPEEETAEPEEEAVCDTAAASETVTPEEVPSETGEPQEKDISSEIPKLQKATVILVDIKSTSYHLSAKEADEAVDGETARREEEDGGKQEHISEGSAKTDEKQELEGHSEKAEETQSAVVAEKEMVIETREENSAEESEGHQQQEDDTMGEGIGEAGAKEAGTAPVGSADTAGDHAEEGLPPAEEGEPMSLEEEDTPVVVTRALRNRSKGSAASPIRSTRSRKEVENSEEEEEPAVTTRTLRRGRKAISDTPKGKSRRSRKRVQEEEESVEEAGIEAEEEIKHEAPSEREARLEPKEGVEKAAAEKSTDGDNEEEAGLGPTEEDKEKAPEEDQMEVGNEEAAAEDPLVPEGEPHLAADSAVLSATEEEEQPSEETAPQFPDLQETLLSDAQEETSAPAQESVPEPEVKVEEERGEAGTVQAAEEEDTSNDVEQEATVIETRTRRSSRKQAAEATPRTRAARSRQTKGDGEKEAASGIQEEEPVRVLRRGRKSIPSAHTTRKSPKEPQEEKEEEGGEEERGEVAEVEKEEERGEVAEVEKEKEGGEVKGEEEEEKREEVSAAGDEESENAGQAVDEEQGGGRGGKGRTCPRGRGSCCSVRGRGSRRGHRDCRRSCPRGRGGCCSVRGRGGRQGHRDCRRSCPRGRGGCCSVRGRGGRQGHRDCRRSCPRGRGGCCSVRGRGGRRRHRDCRRSCPSTGDSAGGTASL